MSAKGKSIKPDTVVKVQIELPQATRAALKTIAYNLHIGYHQYMVNVLTDHVRSVRAKTSLNITRRRKSVCKVPMSQK